MAGAHVPAKATSAPPAPYLALIALAALYALTHPFAGLVADSQIYMGRALADLDPAGVGRDLMFRFDGQSRFSIFPAIAAWLVARVGLIHAAMWLVGLSGALWFGAALVLARQAAPARMIACAAVLILAPAAYGGFNLLRFAEGLAEPRPFAEAFVVFALGAWLAGRRVFAVALLAVAILFHPIMALAGVATLGVCLCFEDRRWLLAALLAAALVVLAAALGAPLADRLRVAIDPDWLGLLIRRNAYLFPHLWPWSDYALEAVQAITILLAARHAAAPLRRLLLAGLIAGVVGVAAGYVCGRIDPVLLIVQVQLWRMWWLTGVLASLALALCAFDFGRKDGGEQLALALLALAWALAREAGPYAPLLAAGAAYIDLRPANRRLAISESVVRALWLGVAAAVVMPLVIDLPALRFFAAEIQPDFTPSILPLALKFLGPPLLFAAVALAGFGPPRGLAQAPRGALTIATALFAALAVLMWDDASSFDKGLGGSGRQADLMALTPRMSGEILWLDSSLEPWIWLGRPSWSADLQGAGSVFSRDLALLWRDRASVQIEHGLRDESMLRRLALNPKAAHPVVALAGVEAICRLPDAPAYIVAPQVRGAQLDPRLGAKLWKPPAVRVEMVLRDDGVEFPRTESYAIIDCADHR